MGEWNEDEKALIQTSRVCEDGETKMAINYLEMAAVLFLLDVSEGRFEEKRITIYCDNEGCVKLLRSYKTRSEEMSSLVEGIDLIATKLNLDFDVEWISTHDNVGSDALSRDAYVEFEQFIRDTYHVSKFVQVFPSKEVRDIGRFVHNTSSIRG